MNVILEINELILDGLGPLDGQTVRAALEQELAGLIQASGLPGYSGAQPDGAGEMRLPSKSVSLSLPPPPYPSASLGAQVARAIYGGLRR